MKIISWNVNSIKMRKERLLKMLETEKPEIVCLQELKCVDENFPSDEVLNAGYHAAIYGQKTYNGVAILSKQPIQDIERGMTPLFEDGASRVVGGTTFGIRVYSTYVPNGQAVGSEKFAYKVEWLTQFQSFVKEKLKTYPEVAFAGDFNIAPEDRDVHDPKAWEGSILCSPKERELLSNVLREGLNDTFRKHVSDPGYFSWWDYRNLSFPKNFGLRIDFIYCNEKLYERCSSVKILRDERKGQSPSDHAPVIATFE